MPNYTYTTSWFNYNLVTSPNTEFSRLKVDSQQTSFEEGKQFRFFDRLTAGDAITSTQQVVYYVSTVNAINLFSRILTVHEGGREYLVYLDDGSHTFTGTLADSGVISPIRPSVGLSSSVSIQRAVGAGIFTAGNDPVDGTMAVADTNAARAVPVLSPDSLKVEIPAGGGAYVVLNHLGSNDNLVGQLFYAWEETI
ncbi:MAG: hypothetical protein ACN2B6_11900 [Rickettsiales bacterium]